MICRRIAVECVDQNQRTQNFNFKAPGTGDSDDRVGRRGPRVDEERRERTFLSRTVIIYSIIGNIANLHTNSSARRHQINSHLLLCYIQCGPTEFWGLSQEKKRGLKPKAVLFSGVKSCLTTLYIVGSLYSDHSPRKKHVIILFSWFLCQIKHSFRGVSTLVNSSMGSSD